MKHLRLCLALATLAVPCAVAAETVYVSDQQTVALRADSTPTGTVVKTVVTGTALEVVERSATTVLVRDVQGTEGWVEAGLLSAQPPASTQAKTLRAELDRTRAQLTQAQTQLDKSRSAATPAPATEELQGDLATVRAQLAQAQADLKKSEERAAANPPIGQSGSAAPAEARFSFLWLAVGFAMLLLGFIGGMVWVKESIRRRMGGLYLRI